MPAGFVFSITQYGLRCKCGMVILALLSVFALTQCQLPHSPAPTQASPLPVATKEAPFVNSLGMKFVPVPGTNILMCTTETTLNQYLASGVGSGDLERGNHPVVRVSWHEARQYCEWLSKRDGHHFRLPSAAEWNAATCGLAFPWGNEWPPPNGAGNYAGQELRTCTEAEKNVFKNEAVSFSLIKDFFDQHKFTAPVASYPANMLGIYDLGGNVWEWCEDLEPYVAGSRAQRGGSWWDSGRDLLGSKARGYRMPDGRSQSLGFRVVMTR